VRRRHGRGTIGRMCRWLAYSGSPLRLDELLFRPERSLVDQSLHSLQGATTTNGDGFGVGWYAADGLPRIYRSTHPAWNDRNLRELSGHIESGLVFAHIRASTGSPVQQTNCHPFRNGHWLFMHNGFVDGFHEIKRDLALAVDPSLYPEMEGTTDTEMMFHLALTFGLKDDPPQAVARTVGLVEATGREHGIEFPFQGTIATTDGERIWAFRYSSKGDSRSLFFSTDLPTLRELYPENEELQGLDEESRLVVSEPLGDLPGAWNEVPESSYGVIQPGQDEMHTFEPIAAAAVSSRTR